MPYAEPPLAWLDWLNRRKGFTPRAFTDNAESRPAESRPAESTDAPIASVDIDRSADLENVARQHLDQFVVSPPYKALARQSSISIRGDAGAGILTVDHLRAARVLLGWSMSDLALKSGLSLSTIKRVEQEPLNVTMQSYRLTVATLRIGGIRFLTLDDGTIAVAKATDPVRDRTA
ncbi:hypothetical protein AIGOOFII_1102 [Methylobacterium marchantiae]|nr:hypothetical protein AIGOOFII_1102 [Methylobacterium marchantiae]